MDVVATIHVTKVQNSSDPIAFFVIRLYQDIEVIEVTVVNAFKKKFEKSLHERHTDTDYIQQVVVQCMLYEQLSDKQVLVFNLHSYVFMTINISYGK